MKRLRVVCVDCGLVRAPLVPACGRCASTVGAPVRLYDAAALTAEYVARMDALREQRRVAA